MATNKNKKKIWIDENLYDFLMCITEPKDVGYKGDLRDLVRNEVLREIREEINYVYSKGTYLFPNSKS